MKIANLLKHTKTIQIENVNITVKKYPLSFKEFSDLKSMEGKSFSTDSKGKIKSIQGMGNYDLDLISDKIFFGIDSWELLDDHGHVLELTKEACFTLAKDYPDFSSQLIKEIEVFNSPISDTEKKS